MALSMRTDRVISRARHAIAIAGGVGYGLAGGVVSLPGFLGANSMTLGMFLIVSVALPAGSVFAAVVCPRKRVVLASVVSLFAAFWLTRAMYQEPRVWAWTGTNIINWTHPVLLASLVVSLGLAMVAAAVCNAAGRVGAPASGPTSL